MDVFISYKRERREHAERLAAVLEAYGYDVFWDYHLVVGPSYTRQLLRMLTEAKAVIVLWCSGSVESSWVLDEVRRSSGKLLPAQIELVDPPLGYGDAQIANLCRWTGGADDDLLKPLIAALEQLSGKAAKPAPNLIRVMKLLGPLPDVLPIILDPKKDSNAPPILAEVDLPTLPLTDPEQIFERALTIADRYLNQALDESGDLADYVAIAMVEVSVNQAIDVAGHADIVAVLRDLAGQIEDDAKQNNIINPNDPASWGLVSRNAVCPCGSGKKYKHCHGDPTAEAH